MSYLTGRVLAAPAVAACGTTSTTRTLTFGAGEGPVGVLSNPQGGGGRE